MKPVYRCEYCGHMGTEDEVREHEVNCYHNYDRRSCWTCKYRDNNSIMNFRCLLGTDIPDGKLVEFCRKYENDGKRTTKTASDVLRGLFGGL